MKQSKIPLRAPLARSWFLEQGLRQVPPDEIDCKILWTDGQSQWISAYGRHVKHDFSPSMRDKHYAHGHGEPKLRSYGNRRCRILMGVTFYGKRTFYKDKHGKPYPGIAHHLINDLTNYSADNLLCWLTREQHAVADARRRAMEAIVPEGDLTVIPYDVLRRLQDPRVLSDADFQSELARMANLYRPSMGDFPRPER